MQHRDDTEPIRITGWKVHAASALLLAACAACYGGGFDPWGDDSSLVVAWTIDGQDPSTEICDAAGAATVRMSINTTQEPWYDNQLEWECPRGQWDSLDTRFAEGEYWLQLELLDSHRSIIVTTPWERKLLVRGSNSYTANFHLE
jgi:hypothetical protein